MIKLAVSGCKGRMGQRITELALLDNEFALSALLEAEGNSSVGQKVGYVKINSDYDCIRGCDVLIEFTTPEATMENLDACLEHQVKMVIGTTGLDDKQRMKIIEAAQKIPIVYSSNMSVGVNILFKLVEIASQKTKNVYKPSITEAHHVHKKDAPSGTAKTLAQIIEEASKQKVADIKSIREGEIVGDHTVVLDGPEDIITVTHHAKSRDIFAKGALVAAKFLINKKNGLFNMQDVLGLK
ncbi:MAG: 4-hydroxy-tetrahydrodipicolinate reductase [Candidatus Omnitrophica bacterium]|nr:4-hydroxy-tetrahydrodipicolinate reductase [Candidatus Omnitrophota bacterium]